MGLRCRHNLRYQWTSGGIGTVGTYQWTYILSATLVLTTMADYGHSLLRKELLPSSFPELKHPRIQLVHTRADQGALLQLYNVPEILDPRNIPIHCDVTGGTWKTIAQDEWRQANGATPYEPSRPTIWKPPGISGGELQTRTDVKVAYEVEGLLQCTYAPLNLSSNRLVLRFENTSSAVVGLKLSSGQSIHDILEDYSYVSSHEIVARLLSREPEKGGVNLVARVTYNHRGGLDDDAVALEAVENLTRQVAEGKDAKVQYVRSTRYCHPIREGEYSWPMTAAGRVAVPLNPCVGADGVPGPKRDCKGDFSQGVYWEETWSDLGGPCIKPGARADSIQDLILTTHEEGSFEKLRDEVAEGPPLRTDEIILVSRFLTNFAQNLTEKRKPGATLAQRNVDALAEVVSRVLDSGRDVIERAEDAPEDLLDAVDLLVSTAARGPLPANASRSNFAAAVSPPRGSSVLGVAAISSTEGPKLVHVPCNASIEDVAAMSLAAAVLLLECPEGGRGVASTVFEDDALFVSSSEGGRSAGPVIGFALVEGGGYVAPQGTVTVLVLFAMENGTETNCSFWDKEKRTWNDWGCALVPPTDLPNGFRGCLCTHLTYFAMIISTGPYKVEEVNRPMEYETEEALCLETVLEVEDEGNSTINSSTTVREKKYGGDKCSAEREMNDPLKKLSLISCCVSLAFLLCIFVVAALYPSWRRGAGRKIQLHLSASLALLMSAYITVAVLPTPVLPGFPAGFCVAMGVLLHYSLLAAFSWTLVVAILQALRLSPRSVLDSRSRAGTHLVMRASAFGWGMPLIPVAATLSWGPLLYPVRPCTALCYPEGVAFYAGVFAPVTLAIAVNAFAFAAIMRFMFCTQAVGMRVHRGPGDRVHARRFLFTLFLFVLLGLNWAVGLLLEAAKWDAAAHRYIAYAFCSTATLQGASLFLFFVACERTVSGKIGDDLAKLKRRSYDVASRFRHMRSIHSTASDRFSSTPSTPTSP